MAHKFARTEREEHLVEKASRLGDAFQQKAAYYDQSGEFPFDHFNQLVQSGYSSLTIPKEYGGEDLTLAELVLVQETLALSDPATALGMGWHLGVLMDLATRREWPEEVLKNLCLDVSQNGKLVNRAMTEKQTGSPTRGGKPHTTAKKIDSGWLINGQKTFTTLAHVADWFIITASIVGTDEVAGFLVNRNTSGVSIENTWDTVAMKATGSDDLILSNVEVPIDAKVETFGGERREDTIPPAWLLHIPACYVGIAMACLRDVIAFARTYRPNSLDVPISNVPRVRDLIGEIELELISARHTLYSVARQWDENRGQRTKMGAELSAAKTIAVRAASRVVEISMKIVGGKSIYRDLPFERYYRDIIAGQFNPPTDDSVLRQLAASMLDE